jgi:hypothetical protein
VRLDRHRAWLLAGDGTEPRRGLFGGAPLAAVAGPAARAVGMRAPRGDRSKTISPALERLRCPSEVSAVGSDGRLGSSRANRSPSESTPQTRRVPFRAPSRMRMATPAPVRKNKATTYAAAKAGNPPVVRSSHVVIAAMPRSMATPHQNSAGLRSLAELIVDLVRQGRRCAECFRFGRATGVLPNDELAAACGTPDRGPKVLSTASGPGGGLPQTRICPPRRMGLEWD